MKDNPGKVSIIVPAYHAEPYIEKCIKSFLGQTYRNLEVILVDDGSMDATGKICDSYEQRYPFLIKAIHKRHSGVSQARLEGVRKATGSHIAFVDADDWIEPDYISEMMSDMGRADLVAAGILRELMDGDENKAFCEHNGLRAGHYVSDSQRTELYGKMLYCQIPYRFGVLPYLCNKIFRKSLIQPFLENVDKRIVDGEDVAVVYPYLLKSTEIVLTDTCKYHYIRRENSASLRDDKDAYRNASYLYQELYKAFAGSKYQNMLMMQLDQYMRLMIWKKDPEAYLKVNSFVFPYDKVKPGARIILYGMGKVGRVFYQQLRETRYCEIVAWADRNPTRYSEKPITTARILPDEIGNFCFDAIVIAVYDKMRIHQISEELKALGIKEEKIVKPDFEQ